MLTINGIDINKAGLASHFPDGTQLLKAPYPTSAQTPTGARLQIVFSWRYESDEELVSLVFLSKHYRDKYPYAKQGLTMHYVPNARMDRVKHDEEVFTLKYFCQVINDLHFDRVIVLDPHSNVTPALLDRVEVLSPKNAIENVMHDLHFQETDYLYFPDDGARKRYNDMVEGHQILVGHKLRDWETGKILGLEVSGLNGETFEEGHFQGCSALMIDDIISYGGTLAYSADKLKSLGFEHIYAYATHTENSILDPEKGTLLKRLEDGTVDHIYTTCSTYTGKHDKITAFTI